MNYYYSQRYFAYASSVIGHLNGRALTMADSGCLITCGAMLISYFNDRALYPDQFLNWLRIHKGLTAGGKLYWNKISEATNNKLRYSTRPNPKAGEITYGIRQVTWGNGHWVFDSPTVSNVVIDPYTGTEKPYNSFKYTGYSRFYLGKR